MTETLFFLRKAVAALLYPPTFCLLAALFGCLLAYGFGKRRVGGLLVVFGLVLLFLLSIPVLQRPVVRWAEEMPAAPAVSGDRIAAVVVLGTGARAVPADSPPTHRLGATGLARAVEGVRLAQAMPALPLVLTGGAVGERTASSEAMRAFAISLGVDPARITAFTTPTSTAEEACETASFLGEGARILLVSSATHLPRAVELFRSAGLDPIPAPVDFLSDPRPADALDFLPSAEAWRVWQRVFHEWYGRVWARL